MSLLGKYRLVWQLVLVGLLVGSPHFSASARDRVSNIQDARIEIQLGKGLVARIRDRHALFEHEVLEDYVSRVGNRLAAHAGRPEIRFQFSILNSDLFGSYAVPGGYVFITLGALNAMNDEAELAALLSHEIAHVSEMHLFEDLRPLLKNGLGLGTAPAAVSSARLYKAATAQASERGVAILFDIGLPLEKELEADRRGAQLLVLAGYEASALRDHLIRSRDRAASTHAPDHRPEVLERRLSSINEILTEMPTFGTKKSPNRREAVRTPRQLITRTTYQ